MNALLSTAYWPNLHYCYYVFNANTVYIEQWEHFQKQSYRNRTQILSANGVLELSVPVKKKATKEFTKDIEISYQEKWQNKHWRAITSAYKNSPYFEYFEEDVKDFYVKPYEKLLDYNMAQLQLVLKILKLKKQIVFTETFEKEPLELTDRRESIHPKKKFETDAQVNRFLKNSYYQTFENKFEFQPNLSILDLLFNKGMETIDYLILKK